MGIAGILQRPVALTAALLLPILAVDAVGFVLPILHLAALSFREALVGGGIGEAFSLGSWKSLFADTYYLGILGHSIAICLLITFTTLLASYPIAFHLHRAEGRQQSLLVVLVISPLLTSAVVRTFGWIAILSDNGLLAGLFGHFGIRLPPILYNTTGVVVGMTEILMPYMILSLLAGFGRLDRTLEDAARTLGASGWRVFRRVVLPLTAPGIALGSLLVFVLAISSFITPNLLGGGRVFLLATEIYDEAVVTLNWPLAATLSMVVLVVFGLALALYARLLRALTPAK